MNNDAVNYGHINIEVMDDAMVELLRKKTGYERLQMAFDMWDFAHEMLTYRVTDENPDWSEAEIRKEVGRRLASGGNS